MGRKLVLDIGMHKGEDTRFYLSRGFKVVGVEANPALVELLQQRFQSDIEAGHLVIVPKAIADRVGTIDFYVNDTQSVWGSIDPDFVARNAAAGALSTVVKVECITLVELLSQFDEPYFIKIDIEGADFTCLRSLAETTCRPKYLSIESSVTSPKGEWVAEFDLLSSMGYDHFKFVDQSRLHEMNGMLLSREGREIEYHYTNDSSGPFGEETPGNWLDSREAQNAARRLRRQFRAFSRFSGTPKIIVKIARRLAGLTNKDPISWYDLHARLAD